MHQRPRGALLAFLATALAASARIPAAVLRAASAPEAVPETGFPTHHRSRGRWGQGKKRYHEIRGGKRVAVAAGNSRPAGQAGSFPNDGTHIEHGHAVWPAGKPTPSNKVKRRKAEKKAAARKAAAPTPPLAPRKSGGNQLPLYDLRRMARAHRRKGLISARQQRKAMRAYRQKQRQGLAQPAPLSPEPQA